MAQKDNISENQEEDDVFGLPEIEYKPLESKDSLPPPSSPPPLPPAYRGESWSPQQENKPDRTWLWVLLFLLLLGAALFLGYKYLYLPERAEEQDEVEVKEDQKQDSLKALREDSVARAAQVEVPVKASIPANPAPPAPIGEGSIETLTAKTGRYYIIVSSSVDADLSMDSAKKLKRKGKSVKLIEYRDQKNVKYMRLAIADFSALSEAQGALDGVRQEFANAWVSRY